MGHSIHHRYKMKLNKSAPFYDGLINAITIYLKECQNIDKSADCPSENYSASAKEVSGELVVSFLSYKSSAPVSLSSNILQLVKENINTDPSKYYYYLEEEGYDSWSIRSFYGKADLAASRCSTLSSSGVTKPDDLKKFHDTLYGDSISSVVVTDTSSLLNLIQALEFKSRELCYLNKSVNRVLIPLWRNPKDGWLWLAGQAFDEQKLTLYTMKVTNSGESKHHHISEYEMSKHSITFEDFIKKKQKEIAKNLSHPQLVSVAINRGFHRNSYTGVKFQYAHFKENLNLFDEKGPFIEIKNQIV